MTHDHNATSEPKHRRPTRQWAPIRVQSLSSTIVERFRLALFSGQLHPGDFLGTEGSLADDFGVSRMVARDALRSLSASGIVEIRTGAKGGAWIAKGSIEHVTDSMTIQLALLGISEGEVIELLAGLEAVAAELAAERVTPTGVSQLRGLLQQLAGALNDPYGFTQLAVSFHESVVRLAKNEAMLAQYLSIKPLLFNAYQRRTTEEIATRALDAHTELVRLIETGDGPGAYRHMHARMTFVRHQGFGAAADVAVAADVTLAVDVVPSANARGTATTLGSPE
jgi:GntR family transcriptional regulator, transcriptional repressor for pyruvate dehydrogenase complex